MYIGMNEYVDEVISAYSKESKISSSATSPARANLLTVDTLSPRLDKRKSELFHHCVAKLLYVSKRCRLDILLTVRFLCTRVTRLTEEDWLKLKPSLDIYMEQRSAS